LAQNRSEIVRLKLMLEQSKSQGLELELRLQHRPKIERQKPSATADCSPTSAWLGKKNSFTALSTAAGRAI
jgi:hypothetical protein